MEVINCVRKPEVNDMRREAWPGLRVYDVLQCRGQAQAQPRPEYPARVLATYIILLTTNYPR